MDGSEQKLPGLFDWIESINSHKVDLMETPDHEKAFDPFMVRRALAMNKETILLSSIMNMNSGMTPYMQYQFLLATVPKKKRYNKWAKKTPLGPEIEIIARHYNVNMGIASGYRKLLTDAQVERIVEEAKGGGFEGKAPRGKRK